MRPTHLADVSAWGQLHRAEVAARLTALLISGATATCGITDLEVAASAVDGPEHRAMVAERRLFPRATVDDAVLDRALEVQAELVDDEPVPLTALIVAAAAERAELVVLHHDAAFDRIAAVTGQPVEWVAPRGAGR